MIMKDTVQATINTGALIKEIMRQPPQEAERILYKVRENLRKEVNKALRNIVNEHKKYVGICFKIPFKPRHGMFPKMWQYCKVISEYSSFSHSLSVLCFAEYPFYWYEYQSDLASQQGNWILGEYDFDGIFVNTVPDSIFNIESTEIISEEEYNKAMNLYITRLQKMKWIPNHYRFGGKLPQDPDWEAKENE